MTTYTVTGVRKEPCGDGRHEHIEGVCTDAGIHYTRRQVVDSINSGNTWRTSAGGKSATIHPTPKCSRCMSTPYIETNPDSSLQDNLENLPRC